ncbi:MAG: hypothetical protein FWD53_11700 [Phycisphaerales bacterium]|nr:hypothetical protein [Phycisphaerales bacterium]
MTGVCVEREDAWWDSKPATPPRNPPHGSEGGERWSDVTAAVPMPVAATGTGPVSTCEPFRAIIEQKVKEGLSGRRIYQDLASDANGLPSPSYDAIKRFLRHMYKGRELPFRRMEVPAGDECQVDFGTGAFVVGPDGKRKKTHVLRIVLSCSRKAYSEAVYRQTTEDFLACLENAFHAFGGVTRTVAGIRRRAGDVCVHRIASDHP